MKQLIDALDGDNTELAAYLYTISPTEFRGAIQQLQSANDDLRSKYIDSKKRKAISENKADLLLSKNYDLENTIINLNTLIMRIQDHFPIIDEIDSNNVRICQKDHCCEYVLMKERKRLHKFIKTRQGCAL